MTESVETTEGEEEDLEPVKTTETTTPDEVAKPQFEIKNLDDLKYFMVLAKGGDPDAIQAVAKFMDLESTTERANFTDKTLMLCVAQLNVYAKTYFPDDDWDPFSLVADVISVATMGYKGFKSEQFKDMTSGQPNLDKLTGLPEETKRGVLAGLLGGKKE